jgi:hypothetical protein
MRVLRKRDSIETVNAFFRKQDASVRRTDYRTPRTGLSAKALLVPAAALFVVIALGAQIWRLKGEIASLREENSKGSAEIAALVRRGDALSAELDKSWKQTDAYKADVDRLQKELEAEREIKAKAAAVKAAKPARASKKKPAKRR